MVGVEAEDVSAAAVTGAVVGLDGLAVVGEAGVVDLPTVVGVDVEDLHRRRRDGWREEAARRGRRRNGECSAKDV